MVTYNKTIIQNICFSLETRITASVKELGELLQKVGGGGAPGAPQPPAHHEADEVLRPLMDILVCMTTKQIAAAGHWPHSIYLKTHSPLIENSSIPIC